MMTALVAFAFLSGLITVLSPCILPVLPIVLSGGVGGGRARPLGVVSGFVASFAFFTLALSAIVQALGVPADTLRWIAIVIIVAFGVVMLVPRLGRAFEMAASRVASLGARKGTGAVAGGRAGTKPSALSGYGGGVLVGLGLGLVWTPCVGPIMASVISLALTQKVDGGAVAITLAYTLGTAVPMLAVMLGGRALIAKVPALARNSGRIQRGFGVVMILVGAAIAFQWDRAIQADILQAFPGYGSGLTAIESTRPVSSALAARQLPAAASRTGAAAGAGRAAFTGAPEGEISGPLGDWGAAPDFTAGGPWLGSPPLDLAALRGKVVLVDFWTYSCVNCVRTLPWLKAWNKSYGKSGLVTIGVHTPEFAFEKTTANVSRAMRDLGVDWPVVQDNDYALWQAWSNHYWPAHYLIDAAGRVRYWHFGEGSYAETEAAIRALLAETATAAVLLPAALAGPAEGGLYARTEETYLGYARGRGFASAVSPVADKSLYYRPARVPANGEWNLEGQWTVTSQYVEPSAADGRKDPAGVRVLELGFDAKDVYLVVEPAPAGAGQGAPAHAGIIAKIDGAAPPDTEDLHAGRLEPSESRLYHIVGLPAPGAHLLRLEVQGPVRLFAFTFG
jgi:cytochrome c biogenesis protein CcdA/thiol-disulfide isomerase/thioredoxin